MNFPYAFSYNITSPFYFSDAIAIRKEKGSIVCLVEASESASPVTRKIIFLAMRVLPNILGMIITLAAYALAINKVKKIPEMFYGKSRTKTYNLLLYPGIIFLTFLPILIYGFAVNVFKVSDETRFTCETILMIISHSIGLLNAIVYGFQRRLYWNTARSVSVQLKSHLENFESF